MDESIRVRNEGVGIFTKLISGFVLIMVVTGLVNFYSYHQMNRLADLTTMIYNHPLRVTRAVLRADTNIIKIHRSMKDVALSSSDVELKSAILSVDQYEQEVYKHLDVCRKWILGAEGAALQAETEKLFQNWKPIRDEVIALTRSGERLKAFNITKGKGAAHVEKLNQKMEELKNYAATKATGMLADSYDTKNRIINTMLVVSLILFLLLGVLGFRVSKMINDSITQLVKGFVEVGRGNYDYKVHLTSRDELNWLASAFNQMVEQRKKNEKELFQHRENLEEMVKARTLELETEIREREWVQKKLEESEGRYRAISENFPNGGVLLYDRELKCVLIDGSIFKEVGLDADSLVGKSLKKLLPTEKADELESYYLSSLKGENHRFEYQQGELYFEAYTLPVRERSGSISLGMAMSQNITNRKQAELDLRKSEEKFRLLFENAAVGVARIDTNTGRFIEVNQKYCDLVGYEMEEMIKATFMEITHPEDLAIDQANMERLKRGEIREFSIEKRYYHKNGQVLWVNLTVSPLWEIGEPPSYHIAVVESIDARKLADEQIKRNLREKEVLLQEVHHRVKNNMQIVASLLRLQAMGTSDLKVKEALAESQNRIYAMSTLHEALYESESLAKINFKEYLIQVTQFLTHTYARKPGKIRFNIEAESIYLDMKAATPLGLTLSELISNSFKHAFPGDASGEIDVTLSKVNNTELELSIIDNGIGMPEDFDWINSSNLGLRLIKDLVEKQLNGTISLKKGKGAGFVIRCSLQTNSG